MRKNRRGLIQQWRKAQTTASIVRRHPLTREHRTLAWGRLAACSVRMRIAGDGLALPFFGDLSIHAAPGMSSAMNYATGLLEYEEMCLVLHCLRRGDLLLDCGANAGAFTLLAAGIRRSDVVAVEPVPATYDLLCANISLNALEGVRALNVGLAEVPGRLRFTTTDKTMNRVVLPDEACDACTVVDVRTVDDVTATRRPTFIKLDVEGFERKVLEGAQKTLEEPDVKVVLVETNGFGAKYGYSDLDIDALLRGFGFCPHRYDPATRALLPLDGPAPNNTAYVRDVGAVQQRLRTAPLVHWRGVSA